jgi:hypothetical protein
VNLLRNLAEWLDETVDALLYRLVRWLHETDPGEGW